MDLSIIDDEEDVDVTEESLTFHSNVRENIVRMDLVLKTINRFE
jgi:hypothetical protein